MTATSNYVGHGPQWSTSGVQWEGKDPNDGFSLSMIYADHDIADTFGMELIEGRFFSREFETDTTSFAQPGDCPSHCQLAVAKNCPHQSGLRPAL